MHRLLVVFVIACSAGSHGSTGPDGALDGPSTGDGMSSPIDGNGCATQPCDILSQCGCSSLEACDIDDQTTGTACRGASGGMDGASCATSGACAARYTCAFFGSQGSCMRFCATDADCASPRGQCYFALLDDNNQPIPGAKLCTSGCDPTNASNPLCPTGWGCNMFTQDGRDLVDCRVGGAGTQGQACSDTAPCAPGYNCTVFTSGPSTCARECAPPSNAGCPGTTTCNAFSPPFVVGGSQYGVCL